ncbi:MAG: TRAP transporter small permease subunit [Sphaerochaetaceae bacterium]|nr:TRAP transporter small permease subunit [Sphaerochaetaceae bacterium]
MNRFKNVLDKVFAVALTLAMILLVVMVVIVFTNVVLRYGFRSGIRWSEEVALIIVIWFTFIAMALGVKENLHISITILPRSLPRLFNDLLNVLKYILEIAIGLILFYFGLGVTKNASLSRLPATGITNAVNYVIVPVSAVFIILYAAYYLSVALIDLKKVSANAKGGK